jgi:hypothetical protein
MCRRFGRSVWRRRNVCAVCERKLDGRESKERRLAARLVCRHVEVGSLASQEQGWFRNEEGSSSARRRCCRTGDTSRGLCLWCYSNIRDGGTRLVWISLRSPPRPLFWADGGVGEESGAGNAGIGRNCSRVFACKRTDQGRLP